MMNQMHHRSIVIAGLGSVGRGMIALGRQELDTFNHVWLVDKRPAGEVLEGLVLPSDWSFRQGDVRCPQWLHDFLSAVPKPVLFVNVCSGIDTVRLREQLAGLDCSYIDSCCCSPAGVDEVRFSRMMPYSLRAVHGQRPHWLCWGINPGVVELVARRLIHRLAKSPADRFEVTVFEYDRLQTRGAADYLPVGWCPEALVEEVMLSPTLAFVDGCLWETSDLGTQSTTMVWDGRPVRSRLVGHEDIWNLGSLPAVANARFVYALHEDVMAVFDRQPADARKVLRVPRRDVAIHGLEQVVVEVRNRRTGLSLARVWQEDHQQIWRQHGINAVQYQTSKSLLLAVLLLQGSRYGALPGSFCASALPVTDADWPVIEKCMERLAIRWDCAAHLGLEVVGEVRAARQTAGRGREVVSAAAAGRCQPGLESASLNSRERRQNLSGPFHR